MASCHKRLRNEAQEMQDNSMWLRAHAWRLDAKGIAEVLATGNVDVNGKAKGCGATALLQACDQARTDVRRADILRCQLGVVDRSVLRIDQLTETVNLLLSAGADPNICDVDGRTPLMCMSGAGHADLVKKLLDSGANIYTTDNLGWTALHEACFWNKKEAVACLLSYKHYNYCREFCCKTMFETPLHKACYNANGEEVVRLLIAAKVDVNARNTAGDTPLHIALAHGYTTIVNILIQEGHANIHIPNSAGMSLYQQLEEEKKKTGVVAKDSEITL
jgi:ankyrin repeat protein